MTDYQKTILSIILLTFVFCIYSVIWVFQMRDKIKNSKNPDPAAQEQALAKISPKRIMIKSLIWIAGTVIVYLLLSGILYLIATRL